MPAVLPQGRPVVVFDGATQSGTAEVDCHGYTGLMVFHEISGATTGGFVEVEVRPYPDQPGLKHPAPVGDSPWGLNVPGDNQATSYVAIFRGLTSRVGIRLNVVDGVHKVTVVPIHV